MHSIQKNPYRLFFLFGTIGLFTGLAVWIVFSFISSEYYLGRMHAHYMIGVFLLNFVAGFLMTAIPRMSGTPQPSVKEIIFQFLPLLLAALWGIFEEYEKYYFIGVALAILVLFSFCFKRIIRASHMVPDVFPFVITGLLSGFLGSLLCIFDLPDVGGRLFYLNMVLSLCVGVGARLIPMILGIGCAKPYGVKEMWGVGILLILCCFIESFWSDRFGSLLRFLLLTMVFFRYWNVHKKSGFFSAVTVGVRLAASSILLGSFGLWMFPGYRLEALHLIFVSGFGLLTLMVASRVILSHGGFDLKLEFNNFFLIIPIALIILSALTRVSAVFIEGGYERHLGFAALSFIVAGSVWSYCFVPKFIRTRDAASRYIR